MFSGGRQRVVNTTFANLYACSFKHKHVCGLSRMLVQLLAKSAMKNIERTRPLVYIKNPKLRIMDWEMILKRNCEILPTECNRFSPYVCMNWCWIILNLWFLDLKCLNLKLSLLFDTIYSAWGCWLLCVNFQPIMGCHLKNSFLV